MKAVVTGAGGQLGQALVAHPPADGEVMLVEDHADLRELMARTIEDHGHTVVVAENGRRALDLLADHRPGLIFLDIMMPVMDGFQFLHELHRHPEWSGIPVVVLTAKSLTPEEREFLMARTDNVIHKRERIREDLLDCIRRHAAPAAAPQDN